MYTISYWHIDSYSELYEFTQDEVFENTVISGTGSVNENPDIRCIVKRFKEEHTLYNYKDDIKASVVRVDFVGNDSRPADLDTIAGIVRLLWDYYCDYQYYYWLVNTEREHCVVYFVISPISIRYGAFHPVTDIDISNLCHTSRLDRRYSGILVPQFPLFLTEDDEEDIGAC